MLKTDLHICRTENAKEIFERITREQRERIKAPQSFEDFHKDMELHKLFLEAWNGRKVA